MKDQSLLNHPPDIEERMQKILTNQEEEITIEEVLQEEEAPQEEVLQEEEVHQEEVHQEEVLQEELLTPEEAKAQPRDLHLEITAPTITIMIEDLKELKEETNSLSTLRTCLLNWMKLI
jgi:hypothetical protein